MFFLFKESLCNVQPHFYFIIFVKMFIKLVCMCIYIYIYIYI